MTKDPHNRPNRPNHKYLCDHFYDLLREAEDRSAARLLIADGGNDDLHPDEEPVEDKGDPQISLVLINGQTVNGVVVEVHEEIVSVIEGEKVDQTPLPLGEERAVLTVAASAIIGVRSPEKYL